MKTPKNNCIIKAQPIYLKKLRQIQLRLNEQTLCPRIVYIPLL